ncbi:hypothetical protein [Amycolatopsis jejuensis]|uniref:hypothetical protein n=1 Tax=Amycolatopsis jejuensis TaxID=330084 RepID=UPI000524844B|nr:hypothetical protein [Amycolatopsis jejuensis]
MAMEMALEVDPQAMRDYAQAVEGLHAPVRKIDQYVRATACDTAGFTGLFTVLQPVVGMVRDLYGETLKFGDARLTALSDGMRSAADHYAAHDASWAKFLAEFGTAAEQIGTGQG